MNQELIKQLSVVREEEKEVWKKGKEADKKKIQSSFHLSADCKKMLDTGELIQIFPRIRFAQFSKHRRNYIQGVYMCKGQTVYFINDQEITLKEGELLFLSSHAERKIAAAQEQDLAVDFIILPEFLDLAAQMMGEEENLLFHLLFHCLRSEQETDNYLYFQVADVLPIQNLMESMVWTMFHEQASSQLFNQASMSLLFMLLFHDTTKLETKGHSFDQNLKLNVLRYVDEHYQDGTLKELCQVIGCDVYWLSRMIKRLTGKNYKELLQVKRLNRAAYLLLTTRMAVAEVSVAVGYDNTSYFHRIFRDYYGMSPKEYRRENKKENR